jgi:hypothetical protein
MGSINIRAEIKALYNLTVKTSSRKHRKTRVLLSFSDKDSDSTKGLSILTYFGCIFINIDILRQFI